MARTTLTYEDDIDEWVQERLVAGQNRTDWLRYAVKTGFAVDGILDELYDPWEYEKRQEFVEAAVREKVDEVMAQGGDMTHENITGGNGEP